MATIAEKSRTKEIIDRLQGILNNASPVPLASGKVTIYKDEVQSLLDELAMQMDAEIKTYHEVNDRKGKILNEAKKEAEKIIYEAEHTASRMRVSKRVTNVAVLDHDALSDEEISSLTEANEIYAASLIYTDEMLTEVSKVIEDAYHNIRSDYEVVMNVLEEKMHTLVDNKQELMTGLQELDAKDRSQQILEIGQLLSQELYNERMKKRMNSDQYEDGSVQLTLDLQVEQAEEKVRQTTQALEQMTAQRDALMQTVMQMEQEKQQAEKTALQEAKVSQEEDEEEYEIVYVTEDELEEGEEYEIEYVDDDELEEDQQATDTAKVGGIVDVKLEKEDSILDADTVPLDTKKVNEVIKEKEEKEKKGSGFIERAVANREMEEAGVSVERDTPVAAKESDTQKSQSEIKTDAKGNQYVQATMQFDDNFEITEF